MASALHEALLDTGDFVPYHLERVGKEIACACPTFVSRNEEYIPAWQLVNRVHMRGDDESSAYDIIKRRFTRLGINAKTTDQTLSKMIVCDFLIANTDRHLNNFGVIRNVDTLEYRIAPLFDSGNSLWFSSTKFMLEHGNYDFQSRPFDKNPETQTDYIKDISWLDMGMLDEFVEQAVNILSRSESAHEKARLIGRGIQRQIELLENILY